MRKTIITAGAASALALAVAGPASASVAADSNGYGFVGKGDVQSAFTWPNATLQAQAGTVKFSSTQSVNQSLVQNVFQPLTQTGTQSGTQTGTQKGVQIGTQDMTETIRCSKNGNDIQNVRHGIRTAERTGSRTAYRDADRTASRIGSRVGKQTGTRSGTRAGSLKSSLNGDPRQTKGQNQFTGFNLSGFVADSQVTKMDPANMVGDEAISWNSGDRFTTDFGNPTEWGNFGPWGSDVDYDWGDYTFAADPATDPSIQWGAWDTDGTNQDADNCYNQGNAVITLHTVEPGAIHDGEITDYTPVPDRDPSPVGGYVPGDIDYSAPIQDDGPVNVINTVTGPVHVSAANPLNGDNKTLN